MEGAQHWLAAWQSLERQRPQPQGSTDCVGKTQELKRENLRCLGQPLDIEPASGVSEAIIFGLKDTAMLLLPASQGLE